MQKIRINCKKTITLSVIFGIVFTIIGFTSGGLIEYSYADDTNKEKILLYMCLEKQRNGLEKDCDNIQHNLTDSHTVKSSNIGIILSNTCLAVLSSNMTDCPNYDLLQKIYPSVIVNPDSDVISKIRLITISPYLPEFKLKPNSTKTILHNDSFAISFGKSVYVDDSCENATISTDLSLLGGLIWHMTENCEKNNPSLFATHTITQDAIPFSYNSSKAWNELQYWKNIKEECKIKC